MKKVLFIMNAMHVGGTEKAFINLVNEYSAEENDITLMLLEKTGKFLPYIPAYVHINEIEGYQSIRHEIMDPPLQIAKEFISNGRMIRAFGTIFTHLVYKMTDDRTLYYRHVLKGKKNYENYDIVNVFDGPFDLLTVFGLYCVNAEKKIQWIHFDVSKFNFNALMCRKLYPKFDQINVVSNEAKEQLIKKIPEIAEKTVVYPNVVSQEQCRKMAEMGDGFTDDFAGIRIVTVGRLSEEKGQDIIPEVAAQLKQDGFNFRWYLVGDGKLRPAIEQKREAYAVNEHIVFLGTQVNPYQFLKGADLYVQTSKHEGFCITLAEAKAFDLPIVSTDCAGAHEQLDGQKDCAVVQRDATELYNTIARLLNEKNEH